MYLRIIAARYVCKIPLLAHTLGQARDDRVSCIQVLNTLFSTSGYRIAIKIGKDYVLENNGAVEKFDNYTVYKNLYARYLCSRDALGLKAKQPAGQARRATIGYLVYNTKTSRKVVRTMF